MGKFRIAVLASGRGSNFKAIAEAVNNKELDVTIAILITDNPEAKAIEIAKSNKIPFEIVEFKNFKTKEEADLRIKQILDEFKVDLVVLAGYMRIIRSKELLDAYHNKILNIHPSLLPAFKGSTHAQKDAFEAGVKVSGLTIHFVTADLDGGRVIYQEKVDISDCKSAEEVAAKILAREHLAYKKVIGLLAEGKIR